jgi:hypothetical protein
MAILPFSWSAEPGIVAAGGKDLCGGLDFTGGGLGIAGAKGFGAGVIAVAVFTGKDLVFAKFTDFFAAGAGGVLAAAVFTAASGLAAVTADVFLGGLAGFWATTASPGVIPGFGVCATGLIAGGVMAAGGCAVFTIDVAVGVFSLETRSRFGIWAIKKRTKSSMTSIRKALNALYLSSVPGLVFLRLLLLAFLRVISFCLFYRTSAFLGRPPRA